MDKVVTYEKHRIVVWLIWFVGLVVFFTIGTLFAFWYFGMEVIKLQTYELLLLFREDWEIIAEYWQDTVNVILVELPYTPLVVGVSLFILLCFFFWTTGGQRHRVAKRMKELELFRKKEHT